MPKIELTTPPVGHPSKGEFRSVLFHCIPMSGIGGIHKKNENQKRNKNWINSDYKNFEKFEALKISLPR